MSAEVWVEVWVIVIVALSLPLIVAVACYLSSDIDPCDCQERRPPVLVPLLVVSEPMADGLHVRGRVIDEICVWPGLRFLLYRAELWRREEFIVTCPRDCYTEDEAHAMGEEWICRIRANEELKAAGHHEAAEMVWNV